MTKHSTNDSFVRWRSRYFDQKQTASSVMLALSGGSLAYTSSLLSGGSAFIGVWPSVLFHLTALANLLCISAAVFFSLNSVKEFRAHMVIAKYRNDQDEKDYVSKHRTLRKKIRRMSRALYFWQSVLFISGAALFIAFFMVHFHSVLYK